MIHDAHFFAAVRPRQHRSAIRNTKVGTLLRGRWPVATPSLPRVGIPTPVDIGLANLYPYSATIAAAHFECGCVATLVNRACCGWRLRLLDWTCRAHTPAVQSGVMGGIREPGQSLAGAILFGVPLMARMLKRRWNGGSIKVAGRIYEVNPAVIKQYVTDGHPTPDYGADIWVEDEDDLVRGPDKPELGLHHATSINVFWPTRFRWFTKCHEGNMPQVQKGAGV